MTDKENRNTQARFTGYLAKTIHNTRINYLKKKTRIRQMEVNSDLSGIHTEVQDLGIQFDEYLVEKLGQWYDESGKKQLISMFFDNQAVIDALLLLNHLELKIVCARIFAERSFKDISRQMNVTEEKAGSIYYYAIKKMSRELRSRNEL